MTILITDIDNLEISEKNWRENNALEIAFYNKIQF